MRKLLALLPLVGLLSCSGMSPEPTIPTSTRPCAVLRLQPAPPLRSVRPCTAYAPLDNVVEDLTVLNDKVCLSMDDTIALAKWIADVEETRVGLEGCPLVQLVDE